MNESIPRVRNARENLVLVLKGFGMGTADVIPGISGGTIAFITGIYEELIEAIRSFDLAFVKLLCRLRFAEAFGRTHWRFLVVLLSGILAAIFTLAGLITWLLDNRPAMINGFFFGLIAATVPVIIGHLRRRTPALYVSFAAAAGAMYVLVGMVPVATPETPLFIFLSGALAICAMILPGISGAFILVLLGKYEFIISAVHHREIAPLFVLALGCAAGLFTFIRVLHWLLARWHDETIATLAGLVLGSLRKIWPWKAYAATIKIIHGQPMHHTIECNVWPLSFGGKECLEILLAWAGFMLAIWLGRQRPK